MTANGLPAAVTAAAAAGLVGLLGVLLTRMLARSSVAAAMVAAPVVVVVSIAGGVVAAASVMALSSEDTVLVLVVLLVSAAVSLAFGVPLARRVRELDRAVAHREAEHELDLSRRQMVAWVSHDLRTPLAGMAAMTEALQDGVAHDPERYHRQLGENIAQMSAMVDDLLYLSRIQAGTLRLALEHASLADLVSDTVAGARPLAEARRVRLDGAALDDAPVRVDSREISRVITNLVANAVRHTPPDGTVQVMAGRDDDTAWLAVTDACGGIPDDDLGHVFEPGWRASHARSQADGEGAGLGLAIVQGLVEAHGGRVSVRNVDHGCRFEVRLPAA